MVISIYSDYIGPKPPLAGPLEGILSGMPDKAVYVVKLAPHEDHDFIVEALTVAGINAGVYVRIRGNGRELYVTRPEPEEVPYGDE